MSNSTVKAIEENIRKSKQVVEAGAALERLMTNRDFKKVILEGYFEQEAIRLVHLKSDQNFQSPDMQRSIIAQMDSIGNVHQYLNLVLFKASQASKNILADEEARDEILTEAADHE